MARLVTCRFGGRRAACLLLGSLLLSGCVYEVPLGGISPGRGRPLPGRSLQGGFSMGFFPELMGTVPEILTNDRVANPVPEGRALISIGGWRMFGAGIGAGLTDWADVGFSLSRGVHSTVRLVESGGWALSVSPAYFRHVTREGDETALSPGGSAWTRVTNLNLTGLLAYRPFRRAGRPTMDVFVGSGHSWYRVDIRDQWREHRSTAPTIVGGFTLDAGASRPQNVGMGRLRISAETAVTFLTQRDGRRDFVVTNRFQMAVQRLLAW